MCRIFDDRTYNQIWTRFNSFIRWLILFKETFWNQWSNAKKLLFYYFFFLFFGVIHIHVKKWDAVWLYFVILMVSFISPQWSQFLLPATAFTFVPFRSACNPLRAPDVEHWPHVELCELWINLWNIKWCHLQSCFMGSYIFM